MPDVPNPRLLIHERRILPEGVPGAQAEVAALANLVITWGQQSLIDPPAPATLNVTLRYRGAVDVLQVNQGDLIEVQQDHPDQSRTPFSGRVRSMSADLDHRGRLLLHITATDHLADLDNTYISTAWHTDGLPQAEGRTVRQRLLEAITTAGWEVSGMDLLPAEVAPSAATFYSSIKLTTLLRRYLAQWGPQATFYDASYVGSVSGALVRRIAVGYMTGTAPGDTLTASTTGAWSLDYGEPSPAAEVVIPASNVLRDVAWDSGPENLITGAQVSRHSTRRETLEDDSTQYVTSLHEVNVTMGAEVTEALGHRAIEVETLTGTPAQESVHRAIGRKWMAFNGDQWRPGALTIHDSSQLAAQELSDMVGKTSRPRQWIVVPGVQVMTPRGSKADLRGLATGGRLAWDHQRRRWDISMTVADTQQTTAPDWTFTDLAAIPDTRFSQALAPAAQLVGFSSFDTISAIGGTTP